MQPIKDSEGRIVFDEKGLYGSYLRDGHLNHALYNSKFRERIESLYKIFIKVRIELCNNPKHPNLRDIIQVSYPNIVTASQRYFNDLVRIKTFHKIDPSHKSKMASYTIRWFNLYPPLIAGCDPEKFNQLNTEEKRIVYGIKNYSIFPVMRYYRFEPQNFDEKTAREIMNDIAYIMATDSLEPHCFAAFLKECEAR